MAPPDAGDTPPVFKVDLSLPPSERYAGLAASYREQLTSLTYLFDDLVRSIDSRIPIKWVHRTARLSLKRLYTHEETEEIKGICRVVGIDLYLLVSFNVVLDLLMGCTSGAALSRGTGDRDSKMLHFRTLDWAMEGLRQLIVQLEFVRSPQTEDVLAASITYVGFVGVLTGVRKGLSISLNFRPNHDTTRPFANYRFYGNHLLVLLGIRRSISSLLRQYLLPPAKPALSWFQRFFGAKHEPSEAYTLDTIANSLPQLPTTAAYLVFCDGASAIAFEKDHRTAISQRSPSFVVATNSDLTTNDPLYESPTVNHSGIGMTSGEEIALVDLIEDSNERRACMQAYWDTKVEQAQVQNARFKSQQRMQQPPPRKDPLGRTRSANVKSSVYSTAIYNPQTTNGSESPSGTQKDVQATATPAEIIKWTASYPISNEMTHFSTVLDPTEGKVVWVKRYISPLNCDGVDSS